MPEPEYRLVGWTTSENALVLINGVIPALSLALIGNAAAEEWSGRQRITSLYSPSPPVNGSKFYSAEVPLPLEPRTKVNPNTTTPVLEGNVKLLTIFLLSRAKE